MYIESYLMCNAYVYSDTKHPIFKFSSKEPHYFHFCTLIIWWSHYLFSSLFQILDFETRTQTSIRNFIGVPLKYFITLPATVYYMIHLYYITHYFYLSYHYINVFPWKTYLIWSQPLFYPRVPTFFNIDCNQVC